MGTLLYGRLWTADGNLVIRYTELRLPNGDVHPVCISVGEEGPEPGYEGSKPGAVQYSRTANAFAVKRWP
ncbi:hypothetical protein D7V88_41465 [Corallococcus terminator]|uniref:Serine/threonine protein kinase n=1 Tax=Corallococcus terminator TaxID=2316733 RepID=A0A3A8H688_9BACT|nr:hypothetical protein D7V88_41465 [Corallococcus terminator]